VRTLIRREFDDAFASVDAVALPTSPTPAFRLGERTADPLQMYLADVFTVTAPLAGHEWGLKTSRGTGRPAAALWAGVRRLVSSR